MPRRISLLPRSSTSHLPTQRRTHSTPPMPPATPRRTEYRRPYALLDELRTAPHRAGGNEAAFSPPPGGDDFAFAPGGVPFDAAAIDEAFRQSLANRLDDPLSVDPDQLVAANLPLDGAPGSTDAARRQHVQAVTGLVRKMLNDTRNQLQRFGFARDRLAAVLETPIQPAGPPRPDTEAAANLPAPAFARPSAAPVAAAVDTGLAAELAAVPERIGAHFDDLHRLAGQLDAPPPVQASAPAAIHRGASLSSAIENKAAEIGQTLQHAEDAAGTALRQASARGGSSALVALQEYAAALHVLRETFATIARELAQHLQLLQRALQIAEQHLTSFSQQMTAR